MRRPAAAGTIRGRALLGLAMLHLCALPLLAAERPRKLLVKPRAPEQSAALDARLAQAGSRSHKPAWKSLRTRWTSWELSPEADAELILARLAGDPAIEAAELEGESLTQTLPDDLHPNQWALDNTGQVVNGTIGVFDADLDAPEAWDLTTGSRSIVVAVLDSGVHTDHPDLGANLLQGYDVLNHDADPWDDFGFGHGTPVAAIIGAAGDNGIGIAGVSWRVGLLPVKVCDAGGRCPWGAIAEGVEYALSRGARVLNLSLACDEHQSSAGACGASRPGACASMLLHDALRAAQEAGALVIAAAGNCNGDVDDATGAYPCSYDLDNILCVAATDARDEKASFSNYGTHHVAVAAPGAEVMSLSTSTSLSLLWDGTSFAAPMATGTAALVLARNPQLTPQAVIARVAAGETLASLQGYVRGAGRLNAATAVQDLFVEPQRLAASRTGTPTLIGDFDGDGRADLCEATKGGGHQVSRSLGSGLASPAIWSALAPSGPQIASDFDGDGRDDIARRGAKGGIDVMLSTGSSFQAPVRWSSEAWALSYAADADGDGRDDLIRYRGDGRWWLSRSTGGGFEQAVLFASLPKGSARFWADVDGDGRADLIRLQKGMLTVALSQGASLGAPISLGPLAASSALAAADVNGDGRADLIRRDSEGCWQVRLGDGAGFSPERPWACGGGKSVSFEDYDGDLRADLIRIAPDGFWELLRSSR